ncbi:MAG: hypothetical protein ACYC5K_04570 [Saccharofermentanales bacterium]
MTAILERQSIMKICGSCNLYNSKNKKLAYFVKKERNWFRANEYRLAKANESACFNEVMLLCKESRWVTILEDSVELITTAGLYSQACYRQIGNCDTPAFLFTMLDETALQVSFVSGMLEEPLVHVSDPYEKNKDLLEYEEEHLQPLHAEKELSFLGITQKQADDVWQSGTENQSMKLMALCDLLGLDYSIAKIGFTEFFQDDSLIRHISENYSLYPLSFCKNEWKIKEPQEMYEGRPAMELLKAQIEPVAGGFDCRFDWINRGGEGGELYLGVLGEAINEDLIRLMKSQPVQYEFSEVGVTCPEKSYDATVQFTPRLNSDTHIYECEIPDFQVPAGIVIPAKAKKKLEKMGFYHGMEIPKVITTSFKITTQHKNLKGITFAVMPMLNTLRGDARYDFEEAD